MKRAERHVLSAVLADVRAWAASAREIRGLAGHLPLSGSVALEPGEAALVSLLEQAETIDAAQASELTKRAWLGRGKAPGEAQVAADRLTRVHRDVVASGHHEVLAQTRERYLRRTHVERERLAALCSELEVSRNLAARTLEDVQHLPITRVGVLSEAETTLLESLVQFFDLHHNRARSLLDQPICSIPACESAHSSAGVLAAVQAESQASGVPDQVAALATRLTSRLQAERDQLRQLLEQVTAWPQQVASIRKSRSDAAAAINQRVFSLTQNPIKLKLGATQLQLLPLTPHDAALVADLQFLRDASLTDGDEAQLTHTDKTAQWLAATTKGAFNPSWECARDERCLPAHEAVPAVFADAPNVQAQLDRLTAGHTVSPPDLGDLLDPTLQLAAHLPAGLHLCELIDAPTVDSANVGAAGIVNASEAATSTAAAAKACADTVRAADVAKALRAMDVEVLKKASTGQIRVNALVNAGMNNVWDVLKYDEKYYLTALPGLGEQSAWSITQAALRLFEGVRDETPVRIDVKSRSKRSTELLEALRAWDAARHFEPTRDEVSAAKAMLSVFKVKALTTHVLVAIPSEGGASPQQNLSDLLRQALSRRAPGTATDVWQDFLSRPADYFGMLTELGFVTEDEAHMHGDLPQEIIEAVRAKELKRDFLTASLRAYQSFGARFALVQEKVVIGDEMGLGKTVEALAVLAHLRAVGHSHFLVVCPAAVVSNWIRETTKHTTLKAFRLHGPIWERNAAAKAWLRTGGIAVTTYDLLPWSEAFLEETDVACAIFDEAHYIKNPQAKRSQAAHSVIDSLKYAVLMTGTPLENTVQEFRNLIGYLRPDLAGSAPEYLASKFRRHVAPAYLRRNQEDVLTELPELVEVDEWMGMSEPDQQAYRSAVQDGQFMLMRRAAMLSESSLKVQRLTELVAEAEANDRRVIVFSYFRDVLTEVARLLTGDVFGPLTGSTPAPERQRLIDQFSAARGGAVLVAQISAGGVGLNIQSASVVVICEPQLKPTTESQAIARAHRMGQTNTVQVHRLLSENSVDERIREILAAKRELFDDFARDSVIAESAPDAVDMSDAELARVVIAAERERLFGVESEVTRQSI